MESSGAAKLFDIERDILPEDWQGMLDLLDQDRRGSSWWFFSTLAMNMFIIAPERKAELNIDDTAWQGMLGRLNKDRRESDWEFFSELAMSMTILSADEIRISNQGGLELVQRPSAEADPAVPPRPIV